MGRRNPVEQADLKVARAVAPVRRSLPVRVLGKASELADQPPLITICAATMLWGLLRGNRSLANAGGRMLAAELVATALKSAVKHQVDRTRPRVVVDGGDYRLEHGHDHAAEANSFPSGHTAGAVAVARAVARSYPDQRAAAYLGATAVAAIQVPRCQHYPSDLAAGAVIGLAAEAGIAGAERLIAANA